MCVACHQHVKILRSMAEKKALAAVLAVGALALDRKDPTAPTVWMRQDAAQSPRHRQA